MAAIHQSSSSQYEPQARFGHCSAFISRNILMYGGYVTGTRNVQPPTVVEIFDPATEKWNQITCRGQPPPGFIGASCTVIGVYLYVFGGWNEIHFFNNIHQLNTHSLEWTKLDDLNQRDAPMAKCGAAMVSYKERILIVVGGWGMLPSHCRSGTEYILDPDFPGRGWTNELLCFDVHSRTWSSPYTTGTSPPASRGHSFTMVDLHRAVLFGGGQQHRIFPNYVYILDVRQWMWTAIAGSGPGWPVPRSFHSAVSLHHPDSDHIPDPALMVMWGLGDSNILSDSWVFQVNARQWRKVTLPYTLKGRCTHSTAVVHTSSTPRKLVTCGGIDEPPWNPRDYSTYIPVAETTVVDIEPSLDAWVVTAVRLLGRRGVQARPVNVHQDLQVQPPAPSLLTPWLTQGLLTQQPTTWTTLFPNQQPTTFLMHQPGPQSLTADAFLRQYLSAGTQEKQTERPPIQAPPRYQVTSIPPPRPHPPTVPRPQSETLPVMSSATTHQVEELPATTSFPKPTSDRGSMAAVQATDSVILPKVIPTCHSSVPPQVVSEDDLLEITDYLIELDKTHIYHLGLVLGLSKHRVDRMMDSRAFLDDVITAWLQKVDQVKKRGAPTWQRMVEALRHQRVGQNDIADKIEIDKIHN